MKSVMFQSLPLMLLIALFPLTPMAVENGGNLGWLSFALISLSMVGAINAYYYDKGYRNREKITDEEYASLGYKPHSYSYATGSIVLGVGFVLLNEYYLHWF